MSTLKLWQTWTYNNSWSVAIAFYHWARDHWNTQRPKCTKRRCIAWVEIFGTTRSRDWNCGFNTCMSLRAAGGWTPVTAVSKMSRINENQATWCNMKQPACWKCAFLVFLSLSSLYQNILKSYEILTATNLPGTSPEWSHPRCVLVPPTHTRVSGCGKRFQLQDVDKPSKLVKLKPGAKVGSHNLLTADIWRCFSGTNGSRI